MNQSKSGRGEGEGGSEIDRKRWGGERGGVKVIELFTKIFEALDGISAQQNW